MSFTDVKLPSNRKFGIFFVIVFLVAGAYFLKENIVSTAFLLFGISIIFLIITLLNSELLKPLNKLWMYFGFLLGVIISPIVLEVIFFGLFTPIAVLMRLTGRDELKLN